MDSVMTTLVGHEHRWTVIVEMASVVVSIHCERPATCLPSHRTIEVGESHILVILPAVQDIAFLDEPSGIAERAEIVMTIITASVIKRLVLTIVFFRFLPPIIEIPNSCDKKCRWDGIWNARISPYLCTQIL